MPAADGRVPCPLGLLPLLKLLLWCFLPLTLLTTAQESLAVLRPLALSRESSGAQERERKEEKREEGGRPLAWPNGDRFEPGVTLSGDPVQAGAGAPPWIIMDWPAGRAIRGCEPPQYRSADRAWTESHARPPTSPRSEVQPVGASSVTALWSSLSCWRRAPPIPSQAPRAPGLSRFKRCRHSGHSERLEHSLEAHDAAV